MGDLSGLPHPLSTYENRLKTFNTWPPSAPIGRESLARAGFVYTGCDVIVKCFVCHTKCDNWNFGDTAIRKHKDLQPDCPFVQENTDILSDGSPMIVDPQPEVTVLPSPSNMQYSQVDHGRGPPHEPQKLLSSSAPEFHKVWPSFRVMNKESERKKTYAGWPVTFIRPEDMARAGFVYLKQGDRVQCVFCLGIVAEWEVDDNPFQDHLKHFPRCPFIRGEKCGNLSIEDELRGRTTHPLVHQPPGFDVCGRIDLESFEPERPLVNNQSKKPEIPELEQLNVVTRQPAKYPNYATKEARRESFDNWPSNIPQEVSALADAGFFYTGTTDSVKCFQCGGGLKNWETNDIPWEEHARWFPSCQYVALNKGREYVETSKKNKPPIVQNNNNDEEQSVLDEEPSTSENTWTFSESELETLMNQEIVKNVLELGFEREKVLKALEIRMRKAGYPFADCESLANAVLELPEQLNDIRNLTVTGQEIKVGNCLAEDEAGKENPTNNQKINVNGSKTFGNRPDDDLRLCKVCMDREMNIVFLPCGHFVACVECASLIDICPLCRRKIKGNVRTYWP